MKLVCTLVLITAAAADYEENVPIDCELSDLFSDGTLEQLIVDAIILDEDPLEPPVVTTVLRNHTVCLSVGNRRGKFSSISLLISYECASTGSVQCPSNATEQFNFGCANGQWGIEQQNTIYGAHDSNPLATFATNLRTDCGICSTVTMAEYIRLDAVTYCQGS